MQMTNNQVEMMMVKYSSGEMRVVEGREWVEGVEIHKGCASEFLHHSDINSPLLDYDLSCDMTEAEMDDIRTLHNLTIVRREQFHG